MTIGTTRDGLTASLTTHRAAVQRWPACAAVLAGIALAALAGLHGTDWRHPALALVGLALGFVLMQATFGFAGSFRAVLERGDASGFRAQAVALAISTAIFFPLIGIGETQGWGYHGFVTPIGVSFVIGAVLFGIGMQIGGGCASGTLFALGGGNGRLALTLAAFVAGSAVGAAHLGFWWRLPALATGTTQNLVGWPMALVLHLAIFVLIVRMIPARANDGGIPAPPRTPLDVLTRPWPLLWGAVALALLNAATLVLAGRPWGETAGFTLWGAKIATLFGVDAAAWPYFRGNPAPIAESVFRDVTSVMDFGIVIGATLAAALSSRFVPRFEGSARSLLGPIGGGFLMGYGARLSDGCNIGAYFSALASGSLSGWVWVAAAFLGSWIGLKLRRPLRLD